MSEQQNLGTENLSPYVAVSILHFNSDKITKLKSIIESIDIELLSILTIKKDETSNGKWNADFGKIDYSNTIGNWHVTGYWHTVTTKPAWLESIPDQAESDFRALLGERKSHLILILIKAPFLVLYGSDPSLKKAISEYLLAEMVQTDGKRLFSKIPEDTITNAFLRGKAKQLWMRGLHPQTTIKPNSKIIAGLDLRDAINAFSDQTFELTVAVSDWVPSEIIKKIDFTSGLPANSKLRNLSPTDAIGKKKEKRQNIGLNLHESFIWSKATKNFGEFIEELDKLCSIIDKVEQKKLPDAGLLQKGYRELLKPTFDLGQIDLGRPIDFNIDLPLPVAEGPNFQNQSFILACQSWLEYGQFNLSRTEDERLFIEALYKENKVAEIRVQPILKTEGKTEFSCTTDATIVMQNQDYFAELDIILSNLNKNLSVWYENGFVISQGNIYKLDYKDVPFTDWKWLCLENPGKEYIPSKEKPGDLFNHQWDGDSLFDYVVLNAENIFGKSKDWHLLSDDGSGEISDFIYIDPANKRLKLLHLKGSSKSEKRQIAPAKYEIVVSQAQKNIRFLDVGLLLEVLSQSAGKKVESLTWQNGTIQPDRKAAIKALKALGSFPEKEVIVFQPQLNKTVWDKLENELRTNPQMSIATKVQLLRLKTLMASLQQTCNSLGSKFTAWSDGTGQPDKELLFPSKLLK